MKRLHETVATGPAIAGTDPADPSTPAAQRLFVNIIARKAIELARKMVHKRGRKRNGR